MTTPTLIIYGKPDCCLCTEAKRIAEKLLQSYRFDLKIVDIMTDEKLKARYEFEVPVVFLDGRKFSKYHLDPQQLVRKLERASRPSPE